VIQAAVIGLAQVSLFTFAEVFRISNMWIWGIADWVRAYRARVQWILAHMKQEYDEIEILSMLWNVETHRLTQEHLHCGFLSNRCNNAWPVPIREISPSNRATLQF
jgi:hypothetical protein